MQCLHKHLWTHQTTKEKYLNGCGGTGESNQSASSFVLHSWTGGLQQVVDAADEPGTLRWVSVANLTHRTEWDEVGGGSDSSKFWQVLGECMPQQITPTTYFVNKLHNDQLQNVSKSVNLVNAGAQVIQSPILRNDISGKVINRSEILLHRWNHFKRDQRPDLRGSAS